jgi:signal transduction histidine kinase
VLRAALAGKSVMSGVVMVNGVPGFHWATPFKTKYGTRVLLDGSPLDNIQTLFGQILAGSSAVPGGRGYMVDTKNRIASTGGKDKLGAVLKDAPLEQALRTTRRGTFGGSDGATRFIALDIPGTELRVVLTAPESQLFASLNGPTKWLPWVLFGLLVLAAVALVLTVRRVWHRGEQLRRASLLKTEFLASASHELRSPLNGIIGFAQLMRDGKLGPVSDTHTEALDDILTSSEHLLGLVSGLLEITRAETGSLEFRPEPISLSAALDEVRTGMSALAELRDVSIDVEVAPELPTDVVLDPGRLRQVLFNYLSNALKHTPPKGHVTMRAQPLRGERFRIEVEDSGSGIPADRLGELFTRYGKLNADADGTGLGLAVTKQIVEAQGGKVGVDSVEGEGACFYAVLPLRHQIDRQAA